MKFQNTVIIGAAVAAKQALAIPNYGNYGNYGNGGDGATTVTVTAPAVTKYVTVGGGNRYPTTVTVTAPCKPTTPPPPQCAVKTGLDYIVQSNPYNLNWDTDKNYSQFDVSHFMSADAIGGSQTPANTCQGYVNAEAPFVLYDRGTTIPVERITIQQRGYIYSKTGGTYTVKLSARWNDNVIFWWHGPNALNPTRANAQHTSVLWTNTQDIVFPITVGANEAYPIRFMVGNELGPAAVSVEITDPKGLACFCKSGQQAQSPDCLVTDACDAKYTYGKFTKTLGKE